MAMNKCGKKEQKTHKEHQEFQRIFVHQRSLPQNRKTSLIISGFVWNENYFSTIDFRLHKGFRHWFIQFYLLPLFDFNENKIISMIYFLNSENHWNNKNLMNNLPLQTDYWIDRNHFDLTKIPISIQLFLCSMTIQIS